MEDAARSARHGNATAVQMRKVIAATVAKISDAAPILHSIADWLRSWSADKALSRAAGTGTRYEHEVEEFLSFLGPKAEKDIAQLSKFDIQKYRDQKLKSGLAAPSINLAVKMLRTCLRSAIKLELISSNPADAIDLLPKGAKTKKPFKRDQVRQILRVTTDHEWQGLIKFGYYVGARIGNAVSIQWEDINFDTQILTYMPVKQRVDREAKTLEVPIHPELMAYFIAHRKECGPVFSRLSKMSVSGKSGLSLTFRSLMNKAGIVPTVKMPKGEKGRQVYSLGYHSLRHSFNSDLANLGVSQEIRQKLIGHASETVNDGYTTVEMETFKTPSTNCRGWKIDASERSSGAFLPEFYGVFNVVGRVPWIQVAQVAAEFQRRLNHGRGLENPWAIHS
jgi:integrase